MADFVRSNDFLRRDGLRWPALKLVVCFCLFALWGYWFCFATVGVYEISESSEIQVSQEIHPVEVEVGGRILNSSLALGKKVQAGDLLLDVDDSEPRLELNEIQARLSGLAPQLGHLYQEIGNQRSALQHETDELVQARHEAESLSQQAESRAGFAHHQAEQDRELYSIGTLSRIEMDRAAANAREQAAAAESTRASVVKAGAQQNRNREERLANIQSLATQASALEADRLTMAAEIKRLQHELERRQVHAPVSGTLAEVEPVKPGSVLQAGQKVATILPSGDLKVVAQFAPVAVAGRVKPGQTARLLLDRFSWSQYGVVPLTVQTVGTDLQDSHIKVELVVGPSFQFPVPLQHGLRGTTEVLVERATPLAIALRVAGRYLGGQPRSSVTNSGTAQ
jgi:membrane fusion protein (multidrug efflux system)